jgi:hypothetical protein
MARRAIERPPKCNAPARGAPGTLASDNRSGEAHWTNISRNWSTIKYVVDANLVVQSFAIISRGLAP